MDEVAVDSTVLIFLGKLRRLDWLEMVYDRVMIPPTVYDEVVVQGRDLGEPDPTIVDGAVESGWIEVVTPDSASSPNRFDLEAGEREVLALTLEHDHERVLVDEEAVREVARLLGLEPRGTLSVLYEALDRGEVDFDGFLECLERLVEYGFYLDEAVYIAAVRRARALDDR